MPQPPAFRRLSVDDRRDALLALGSELFATREYDELTMASIAREAGVSKALLYHYFPTKRAFFLASLADGAADIVRDVLRAAADDRPGEALRRTLDAYVGWVDRRPDAFGRLLRSATSEPEVRRSLEDVRWAAASHILAALGHPDPDAAPAPTIVALRGFTRFLDGAMLERIARGAPERDAFVEQLAGTLAGALEAAGALAEARVLRHEIGA